MIEITDKLIVAINAIIREKWEYKRLKFIDYTKEEIIQYMLTHKPDFRKNSNRGKAFTRLRDIDENFVLLREVQFSPNDFVRHSRKNGFSFSVSHILIVAYNTSSESIITEKYNKWGN